jgi:hypothetical protein
MAFALKSPFRRQTAADPAPNDQVAPANKAASTETAAPANGVASSETGSPANGAASSETATRANTATQANASAVEPAPSRRRVAAARGVSAVASVILAIARLVRLATALVVLLIVAAIVLRVASANQSNTIVKDIHDGARALVGPFKNVFSIRNPKDSIAANWGLAAAVYLVVGMFVAGLIARLAPRPPALRPRRTTAYPEETV